MRWRVGEEEGFWVKFTLANQNRDWTDRRRSTVRKWPPRRSCCRATTPICRRASRRMRRRSWTSPRGPSATSSSSRTRTTGSWSVSTRAAASCWGRSGGSGPTPAAGPYRVRATRRPHPVPSRLRRRLPTQALHLKGRARIHPSRSPLSAALLRTPVRPPGPARRAPRQACLPRFRRSLPPCCQSYAPPPQAGRSRCHAAAPENERTMRHRRQSHGSASQAAAGRPEGDNCGVYESGIASCRHRCCASCVPSKAGRRPRENVVVNKKNYPISMA